MAGDARGLELAGAMQEAFYVNGHSLSQVQTYRGIADEVNLDTKSVTAAFLDREVAATARAEQQWIESLGVKHYPTLLVQTPRGLVEVGSPTASASELRAAVEQA